MSHTTTPVTASAPPAIRKTVDSVPCVVAVLPRLAPSASHTDGLSAMQWSAARELVSSASPPKIAPAAKPAIPTPPST